MTSMLRFGLLASCVALGACADLQTISRRTTTPGTEADGKTRRDGLAIHLDAQQRIVSYNGLGKYCAEPSPDALAAYASSLGLGVSAQGYGSASAAQALQSAAASIGLRTQSITLMRDALYRLCEAYLNGELSEVSATMLLARSQDLTAVVVAVEQLTGAVAANQAILTPNSSGSASASLVSNQQLLDAARKDEAEKEKALTEAKKTRDEQQKKVDDKKAIAVSKKNELDAAEKKDPKPSNIEDLRSDKKVADDSLKAEQEKLEKAEAEVKRREDLLAESKKVREIVESNRDAALTQATAATGSSGQFSSPVQRISLDKNASIQVAQSVERMVQDVLKKDYTTDACSTLLTSDKLARTDKLQKTIDLCLNLIGAKINAQERVVLATTFGPDENSGRIEKALGATPSLLERLRAWLSTNAPGVLVTSFLTDREYSDLRRRAISDLRIP